MSLTEKTSAEGKRELTRKNKAQKVVESEGVRLNRFLPSGMTIWTVAGRDCDYLVDCIPTKSRKPYCSCDDFHFRVVSGTVAECYHLVAARKAIEEELYTVVELKDEDFTDFVKKLLANIFAHIS
ncbi:MAG: hypothetical protein ACYCPP_05140 [Nitrososphaerales archaeon]